MKRMTVFCFTDIHCQQAMLDMPTKLRTSAAKAADAAMSEFGKADLCIIGGDNISDYPFWNRSCALPKKNFLDIKEKIVNNFARIAKEGKVLYVAGNNDMILGDTGTLENGPYNTTDFYHSGPMNKTLGRLAEEEYFGVIPKDKPHEMPYLNAFHYKICGRHFIGLGIDPDTAFNTHDGYYTEETLKWLKDKIDHIDESGTEPIFVAGHLAAMCTKNGVLEENYNFETKDKFYDALKGHKNLFYLYGHVHGEGYVHRDFSSRAVLHMRDDIAPARINTSELDSSGIQYGFSLVHMGGLRPFALENFHSDALSGVGGSDEIHLCPKTATPRLAQYLVIEIYDDKAVFHIRNAGDLEGYSEKDKPFPYTVYYR